MTIIAPTTQRGFKTMWHLGGLTPSELSRGVFDEFIAHDLFGKASELAFNFIFALFPLILLMVTFFNLFASRSVELQSDLLAYFADFLPPAAFQLLRATSIELAANASREKLTLSVIATLWFASGGVGSMVSALNFASHVGETRSWVRVRLIALSLTLMISVSLLSALFIVLASSHFIDWLRIELKLGPILLFLWKALQWPAAIIFAITSYSVVYYWGPDLKDRQWHWFTPGATFAAFLWIVASIGFRGYLHFENTYSALYGSLGSMMILLAWFYVAGLTFLIGAEVNAIIERALARQLSDNLDLTIA